MTKFILTDKPKLGVSDTDISHILAQVPDSVKDLAAHEAAADPHTGYILESLLTEQGDIIYASAANTPAALPHGTAGQVLTSGGNAANPSWTTVSGSVATDAIWDVKGDLAIGTGANTAAKLAIGTDNYVLRVATDTPAWEAEFDATLPAALGAAATGSAATAARRDHVHANPAIDTLAAATDITTRDATTTAHGLVLKATAPTAGLYNYVGITNAETAYTNKALFDATVPSTQAFGDSAAAGSAAVAARGDHKHAMMAAPVRGYALQGGSASGSDPADSTTYYLGSIHSLYQGLSADLRRVYFPIAGTVTACIVYFYNGGTLGSNHTSTISFLLNNTSDTTISSSVANNAVSVMVSNYAMSVVVAQGDYFELKWVTPAWTTNPTDIRISFVVYVST